MSAVKIKLIKKQSQGRLLKLPVIVFAFLAIIFATYGFQTPAAKAGSTVTIAAEGTQVSSLQPGTGIYLGGGFTVTTSTSLNLTSLGITVSGSISTANLSNMQLYTEPSPCTNNPTGKTQYASTAATVSTKTTFTQNLALTANGTACFYVVVDVGSGVSDGNTLDLSIAANTDATVSSGGATVTGAPAAITGTGTVAGILTVGQSGTMTSSLTAPSTAQYVGAGFTLSRTNGGANVTSIKITKSGTVSDAAITNLKLYYKTESPCTFGGATGATLFNSTGGTFSSGTSTVTGSFAPGTSQICLYVVVDIGSGAANGSTLGFSINNSSTDVVTSSGTVTPSSSVALSGSATISSSSNITVSGTLYDINETSALLAADALKLSVGGSTAYTTTVSAADGTFSFSGVTPPTTGAILTIWLNGNTDKGVLVFRYSSSSCNGSGSANCTTLKVIKNRIALDSFDGSAISNSDLAACDNDTGSVCTSTDIGFTSNSGVFTATISGEKMKINSGATYAPGGAVTVPQLDVEGTYSGSSETLTLNGSGTSATCTDSTQMPLCVSGTFNAPATTAFTGTSASNIAALTYQALTMNPAATVTYTLGSGAGQTLVTTGTLTIGNGSNALTVTAATNNPNLTIKGNVNLSFAATYIKGSGLTVFQAGATQQFNDNTASKQDLGAVQVSSGSLSTTLNLGTSVKFTSLTVDTSQNFSLNGANTLTLTGSGTGSSRPFIVNGSFTGSTGVVEFVGTASTEIGTAATYSNLKIDPAGTVTYTLGTAVSQALSVTGVFTIGNGTNSVTINASTYNPNLNLGGLTINAQANFAKGSGTISFNSGSIANLSDSTTTKQDLGSVAVVVNGASNTTLTLGSSVKMTSLNIGISQALNFNGANTLILTGSGTPLINAGTYTGSTGTLEFVGTSATTIPNMVFGNIKIDPAATVTYTVASGTQFSATDLTIGDGTNAVTLNLATNNPSISVLGNMTINANAVYTKGTGTLTFKKGSSQTVTDNTSSKQDLGAVAVASNGTNTTVNMGSSLKMTSLNINASQTFSANGSNTLVITGSGTSASRPFIKSGTFTASTGTVEFTGTSATAIESATYNNLTLDPAATVTYTLGTAASQTLSANGNMVIGNGTNAVTVTAATNNPTLNFSGNFTISANAIYTKGTGNFNAKSGTTQTFTDNTAGQNLGKLIVAANGTNTTLNLGSNLTVTSMTINSSQSLNLGANTLTVTGNGSSVFSNSGTFNAGTGTVSYASSAATGTTFPSLPYYNVVFNSAGNTFTPSSGSLSASNDLTISAGTLDLTSNNNRTNIGHDLVITGTLLAPADTLTVSHDFVNNGVFTSDSGAVTISPISTSQIRGSAVTTFNNLTISGPGKTVQFAAGSTFTVNGGLTLSGATGNNLLIQSTSPGSQWFIKVNGSPIIGTSLSIKDSGCASGSKTITASNGSVDQGNNGTCWIFSDISNGGGAAPADGGSGGGTPTTGGTQQGGGTAPSGGGSGSTGGGPTIAFVQKQSNADTGTGSTITAIMPGAVTAGNTLVVAVSSFPGVPGASAVTDSLGNTFTQYGAPQKTVNLGYVALYYAKNIAGGSDTITFTTGASNERSIVAAEFSGLYSSPADGSSVATGSSATAASGSMSPSSSVELAVVAITHDDNVTTTAGTGMTLLAVPSDDTTTHQPLGAAYQILSSGSAVNPSMNLSVSASWAAVGALFTGVSNNHGGGTAVTP